MDTFQQYRPGPVSQEDRPDICMKGIQPPMAEMDGLIDDAVTAFIDRCIRERKERRTAILAANPGAGGKRVKFSYNVLSYYHQKGSFVLCWAQLVYLKNAGAGGKVTRRIACAKGVTHLKRVTSGAHPDEVDLLISHEHQARVLRKMWTDYLVARRATKELAETCSKAAQMRDDKMITQA